MSFVRLPFDGINPMYVLDWKYIVTLLSCSVVKRIVVRTDEAHYGICAGC
ncbi:hypothetical protein [Phocaeicola sp.]